MHRKWMVSQRKPRACNIVVVAAKDADHQPCFTHKEKKPFTDDTGGIRSMMSSRDPVEVNRRQAIVLKFERCKTKQFTSPLFFLPFFIIFSFGWAPY